MNTTNYIKLIVLAGIIAVLATSCGRDPQDTGRTFVPDMQYSQAYEYYDVNMNFKEMGLDTATSRKPVAGTISYGSLPPVSADSLNEDATIVAYRYKNYYTESIEDYERAGVELKNPLKLTDEVLKEGQQLYAVSCAVCHGGSGKGDGTVVQSGAYPPVPSYLDRLPTITEGKMFHSITYGRNLMGSYSSQLTPEERWKVIYYIQKLAAVGPFAKNEAPAPADDEASN